MERSSECSTPISSINGYNKKISQILDERNSDDGNSSEVNSPATTLLKSYLRDSQLFTSNVSPTISKLNESVKQIQDSPKNTELCATPKSVNVIKKKRFDVSSPSAILRERNPFPKEVFDDVWAEEEEELPPPIPYNELLKDLHMYAEIRDKEDNRSAGIKMLLRNMGAIVHDKLDSEVTHVLFREGQLSTYKKAKKQNCHLLSMLWLHAVRNTGRRVPEQNYPALNLDLYESPLANKRFRKMKSRQPDYEDVREDYHRKRLEKVYKQKLAGISSTNGSDSDVTSTTSTITQIAPRKRKSNILPEKKLNDTKRRRTTIMSTTTMESDMPDENIPTKQNKSTQRRKTEFFSSSSILNTKDDASILKERNASTKQNSSVLENRNFVVNQTLRPSGVIDFVEGSQEVFGNAIELKNKKDNNDKTLSALENRNVVVNQTLRSSGVLDVVEGSQDLFGNKNEKKHKKEDEILVDINNDHDNDLTRYSLNIKDRNVVVNCTLTPHRFVDVLDQSQENIGKMVNKGRSPQLLSPRSDTTSQDNDYADSPDLKRVLDAIQNDNSGSLRKKLLKGLGIQCSSDTKKVNKKESPKTSEVFSFVTVRQKNSNLKTKTPNDDDNLKNKTASTIYDSPLLSKKSNELERDVIDISTRRRTVRTPVRYLDSIENYESSSIKSTGRRKTLNRVSPQNAKIFEENTEEIKSTKRQARLFKKFEHNDVVEETEANKSSCVNNCDNDENLQIQQSALISNKEAIPQKIKAFEKIKSTRRRTKLFQENVNDDMNEKLKEGTSSLENNSEKNEDNFRINEATKDTNEPALKIPPKTKKIEKNKSARRRTQLFHESNNDSEKNTATTSKEHDLEIKQTMTKNLEKKSPQKNFETQSEDQSLKDIITQRVSATEPRRMSTRRSMILKNQNEIISINSSKLLDIQEETATTKPLLKSKTPRKKVSKKIPASEPSIRDTTVRKIKLYNPNLDLIDSDISLPEIDEPVENPYTLENKTPKRRKVDLKEDKDRRSTFWFRESEDKQKTESKKITQNCKGSQKKLPTIVCTRLHRDQIDVFNQIVKNLGGFEIENNVSSATTHLVVGEPNRTLNMLRAIIRGCWIVSYEWLLQSLEAGHWLQEELYEVNEFSLAVKKCRVERQTFGEPYTVNLFNECGSIYISTQTSPKSTDLEQLIKLAGGTVVTSPRLARIIVGQTYSNADNNTVFVTEKWVLESITHKSVKSFKKFLLSTNSGNNS